MLFLQTALVNFMLMFCCLGEPKPNNRELKLIVNFTTCDYDFSV